jgi:hypothetical protein
LRKYGLTIGLVGAVMSILPVAVGLMVGAALTGRTPSLNGAGIVFIVLLVAAIGGVPHAFSDSTAGGTSLS